MYRSRTERVDTRAGGDGYLHGVRLVIRPAVLGGILVAANLIFIGLEVVSTAFGSPTDGPVWAAATAVSLASCAFVLGMRRRPWIVVVSALASFALTELSVSSSPVSYLLLAVGCGSVAAWGRGAGLAVPVVAVVALVVGVMNPTYETLGPALRVAAVLYGVVLPVFVASLAVAIGLAARRQQQIVSQLRSQHDELAVLQRRDTAAAVAVERTRIARELHDIVAHHISALLIQAQAGQRIADRSGTAEAARWRSVADVARETLHAMRRVVGLLRTDTEDPSTTGGFRDPQPRLTDLAQLVDTVGRAGLDVHLQVADDVDTLPADLQLCVYRIIQEALTNVLRHASATHSVVRVTRGISDLTMDVSDDGQVREGFRAGNGLLGMRERIASVGGHLEIRADPGHGLRIHARLPLDPAPVSAATR